MAKQSTHIWPQGIHTSILRSEDTQLQKLGKIQSELRKPTKNHVEFQQQKKKKNHNLSVQQVHMLKGWCPKFL